MSDSISTAVQMLARFPLFQVLAADELAAMVRQGEHQHVAMGERIVRRGDVGEHVYLLLQGRVRFSRGQPDGSRTTLAVGTAGDLIGDESLAPPGRIAATCAAADSSKLLRFAVPVLLDQICRRPAVDYNIDRLIRLHRLLRRLRDGKFSGFGDSEDLQALAGDLRPFRTAPGTKIIVAGQTSDEWYFIGAGIGSRRDSAGSVSGIGPEECFGSEAMIGVPNPADIVAVTSVSGLRLSRTDFDRHNDVGVKSGLLSQGVAFSWIGQRGALDCGAAALAMAARRLGLRVSIDDVLRRVQPNERGTPLDALGHAAAAIGLSARAMHASPDSFAALALPAIALLASEHYLVVYKFDDNTVVVGDPARGVLSMTRAAFQEQWTGHLLTLGSALQAEA